SGPSMGEEVVSFAFEPRARSHFRFRILERVFTGGHLVYRLGFEPRSSRDALPAGQVWVDTNDFVIVREEFWYRDLSPAPLFVKRIDSCVVERGLVEGRWWVVTRVLARVTLASSLRAMGALAREHVPRVVDLSLVHTGWK